MAFKQNRYLPPNKRENRTNMCPKLSYYVNHSLMAATKDPRRVDKGVVMVPLHATTKLHDPRKRAGLMYPR